MADITGKKPSEFSEATKKALKNLKLINNPLGVQCLVSDIYESYAVDDHTIYVDGLDLTPISEGSKVLLYNSAMGAGEDIKTVSSATFADDKTTIILNENLTMWEDSTGDPYQFAYQIGEERTDGIALSPYSSAGGGGLAYGRFSNASGEKAIAIGRNSKSTNSESIAIGLNSESNGSESISFGNGCIADGHKSAAFGSKSKSRYSTQIAEANGKIDTVGDVQHTRVTGKLYTYNDSPSVIPFVEGGNSIGLPIPSGGIFGLNIQIVGSNSDGSVAGFYNRQLLVKNISNTISLISTVQTIGTDIETGSIGGISITATSETLKIYVTGKAETNIKWVAVVYAAEVGFYS